MSNTLFNNNVSGWTPVSNKLLKATNLSMKAKALYIYLCSKPNRWSFSTRRIANEMKEGKDSVNSVLNELELRRLVSRRRFKDEKGHFTGVAYSVNSIDNSSIITEYFDNRKDDESTGRSLEDRKQDFRKKCGEVYKSKKVNISANEAARFFNYWTEATYGGHKMRFEMQTAFEIKRRMATWIKNSKQYKNKDTVKVKKAMPINNT